MVDAGKGQKPRSPCAWDAGVGGTQKRQEGTDVAVRWLPMTRST
jgi:hypothetical protein